MDMERRRARAREMWAARSGWDSLYNEAYDYVLPNRRPGGATKGKKPSDKIFDMTGPTSYAHFAGELQRLLFPPDVPPQIEAGPLVRANFPDKDVAQLDVELNRVGRRIYPYMLTGGYDTAISEFCLDLGIGTAAIIPLKGPSREEPVFFVTVPIDQFACLWDGWGRLSVFNWLKDMKRHEVVTQWPAGSYSDDFKKLATDKPNDPVKVYQEFERVGANWSYCVYFDKDGEIITKAQMRTQPVAVARFTRIPGEDYGRGPVLFALPTIKTQNKAQELALRSFAIDMLGIWAYRSGGTFNPDTVRIGAGEMWAMQSTGGIMGPDVTRLDTATGRADITRLVLQGGNQQIREALLDTRIRDDGGTPASASEIAATMRQNANVPLGAYGRLVHSVLPVVIPRLLEILTEWGLMPNMMSINQLLVSMRVLSPMAIAMKAGEIEGMGNYTQFMAAIDGPQRVPRYINRDRVSRHAQSTFGVNVDLLTTEAEKKKFDDDEQAAIHKAAMAEMAAKAALQIAQAALEPAPAAA